MTTKGRGGEGFEKTCKSALMKALVYYWSGWSNSSNLATAGSASWILANMELLMLVLFQHWLNLAGSKTWHLD